MKSNFDHIDNVFRGELKDHSFSSPEGVWENIELQLNDVKKAKRLMFFRIAAAILSITMVGSIYFLSSQKSKFDNNEQIIAQTDIEDNTNKNVEVDNSNKILIKEVNNNIVDKKKEPKVEVLIADNKPDKKYKATTSTPQVSDENIQDKVVYNKLRAIPISLTFEKSILAYVPINNKKEDKRFNGLGDLNVMYAFNEFEETKKSKQNKWLIGGEFSPLYSYRNVTSSGNSGYETGYYNQVENPIMSYSGGVNVQYKALDRLTVQTGVYYSSMGQSLDYMSVYANQAYDLAPAEFQDRYLNAYDVENSAGAVSFNTSYVIVDEKGARVSNHSDQKGLVNISDPTFQDMSAEIQQNFQYIEVPVVFRYKIVDKIVDFNLIGGLGANFLIGNDVTLVYGNTKEIIGETKGVNPVNYTSSIGIGIEYPLMNRINIRVEPSFKYYLNEINPSSTVESHPYSIGVYTGISYSF